ncbi:hypothetical protein BDD12DRAFT_980960 [Trichophaea hybrida]|nr:hypothetical protein BDD12DRAFT_980960 [Trichophaea hybrida]
MAPQQKVPTLNPSVPLRIPTKQPDLPTLTAPSPTTESTTGLAFATVGPASPTTEHTSERASAVSPTSESTTIAISISNPTAQPVRSDSSSKVGIFVGVPIVAVLLLSLGLFFLWRRWRKAQDRVPEVLPELEQGEKQDTEMAVDPEIDTSKEPVPNQPYSENTISPLPERASSPRPPDIRDFAGPEANAPEVYISPPPLLPLPHTVGDIDQEIRMIEEEEERIRLRREMHQEVLRLQLEEERLRARKAELLMARGTR